MNQQEAVILAMKANGNYATLGHLYRTALKIPDVRWGTKTPFASIRRIVQTNPAFFKIKPGLWALEEERESVLKKLAIPITASSAKVELFNHTYYQGLIVEIGNLRNFKTFVPHQDKNQKFLEMKLTEITTVKEFHSFTYENLLRRARTVDVTWFNSRGFPDAFFEVEHSTDIQNSLLKFMEFQDFRIKFRIVADSARFKEYEAKLRQAAFAPIYSLVEFVDYDNLSNLHAKITASVNAQDSTKL